MSPLHLIHHALVKVSLSILRDRTTSPEQFHQTLERLTTLVFVEATRLLPVCEGPVQTPLATAQGYRLASSPVLVPILRAGVGMLPAARAVLPQARVGFIGLRRDEKTAQTCRYCCNLPKIGEEDTVILLDPMLATGGSMADAIDQVKEAGGKNILAVCILGAKKGVEFLASRHPEVSVFVAAVDEQLTDHQYILPGLGDAGDRLFGTVF